jgi:hypothetical protein
MILNIRYNQQTLTHNFRDCYYSAPFITYNRQGSNHFVQDKIIDFMKSVKQRIHICSQYFMDVNPFDKAAKSVLTSLGELAHLNTSMLIRVLKQTRASNQVILKKKNKSIYHQLCMISS